MEPLETLTNVPDVREPNSTDTQVASPLDIKTNSVAKDTFPNLAWEILQLGLKREHDYHVQLNRHAEEGSNIQGQMRQLIDLNGKLTVGDKEVELSDEIISIAHDLEKYGINLLQKSEKKISPDRMNEIKAQIGSHSDRLKTELQNIFSTKIQVTINDMNSIMESLRMIIKHDDRLKEHIISKQTR
ncbi:MAG: hypothetical protein HW387_422 [Parachlamydiales bacterium]|nr:hypothetical protein [Parachlamydiales bacterium]